MARPRIYDQKQLQMRLTDGDLEKLQNHSENWRNDLRSIIHRYVELLESGKAQKDIHIKYDVYAKSDIGNDLNPDITCSID